MFKKIHNYGAITTYYIFSGMKTYSATGNTSPYSKTIDAVVAGNITTPASALPSTMPENKKKTPVQRRTNKPAQPRRKRPNEANVLKVQAGSIKQSRLSSPNKSSQDQVSNTNSEILKLSPAVPNIEAKEIHNKVNQVSKK